ncbi:hypothetical protein P154DRAFT_425222 [Amniculicola lignicola CBS 123094]|uniref:CENP-V/GFA domain-containing protein n=1 Tax=Amniculicola lignicola CBS 123094 TaxID=1392246 RepID=A0A6A5X1B0_9PLEO|nr:hypothetical protein P154DRAFT_425222 [Amniculicola lignicola CBS 123094]
MSDEGFPTLPDYKSTDAQTYEVTCHCGTVKYSVTLTPPLPKQKVVSCNCSICTRNAYLLVYPLRRQVTIKSGEDTVKSYSFGSRRFLHQFCARCGSCIFFDPRTTEYGEEPDLLGVNVRMFKDVKINKLQIVHWDGKSKGEMSESPREAAEQSTARPWNLQ